MLYYIFIGNAVVAQLAEQLIRNEQVAGSIPVNGSKQEDSIRKDGVFCCISRFLNYINGGRLKPNIGGWFFFGLKNDKIYLW